jgi:hypothetical protein
MPFVQGFLRVRERGHPDHDLPDTPTDPGFGGGIAAPIDPGFDIPLPPPGVWPPPSGTLPIVPAPPGTPPGAIWPPIGNPPIWSGGVVPPVHVGGGPAPTPPGSTLPEPPPRTYWVVVGIPGVGWRYAALDPSVSPAPPIAATPEPKG